MPVLSYFENEIILNVSKITLKKNINLDMFLENICSLLLHISV